MALPTPQDAANARFNAGPLDKLGSGILQRLPYVSPIYNILSTLGHLATGTAGQYGPATSPFGRFLSLFSGNPTNAPRALPVGAVQTPGQPASTANPQGPVDPNDPNNPLNKAPSAVPTPDAAAVARNRALSLLQQAYQTGRIPGAPAFSPTLAQLHFPGSAIGPLGGGAANPYDPNATHGTPNSVFTGLSGPAADWLAQIASRNLA